MTPTDVSATRPDRLAFLMFAAALLTVAMVKEMNRKAAERRQQRAA